MGKASCGLPVRCSTGISALNWPGIPFCLGAAVRITFNGQAQDIRDQATIAQMLLDLQLMPKLVAVEVNREVVSRRLHETHVLQPGDEVEVVTLVGGG